MTAPEAAAGGSTTRGSELAPIIHRLVQGVLDVFGVAVVVQLVGLLTPDPMWTAGATGQGAGYSAVFLALLVLLPALTGRTIGMRLLGMRVRRAADREPAGFWRHVVRGLLLPVDLVFLGLIGIVTMLLTGRRVQRLGDLVAGTVVELDR